MEFLKEQDTQANPMRRWLRCSRDVTAPPVAQWAGAGANAWQVTPLHAQDGGLLPTLKP